MINKIAIYTIVGINLMLAVVAQERLEVAEQAAMEAGKILLEYWKSSALSIDLKGKKNYVTNADKSSEKKIKDLIRQKYPQDALLGEETGYEGAKNAQYIWVIDGLDGTTNFIYGRSEFSISIGIIEVRDNKIHYVGGVIYAPVYQQLYKGWERKGAFLNGKQIKVSDKKLDQDPLITVEINEEMNLQSQRFNKMRELLPFVDVIRARSGSAVLDLARVASGEHDAFISFGLHPWDIAAAIIIIKEAGGKTNVRQWGKEIEGNSLFKEKIDIISTNDALYQNILTTIRRSLGESVGNYVKDK